MRVHKQHPFTGESISMELDVTLSQLMRWKSGEKIQNVMPHLSAEEREFLITGLKPGEYDALFQPPDETPDQSPDQRK